MSPLSRRAGTSSATSPFALLALLVATVAGGGPSSALANGFGDVCLADPDLTPERCACAADALAGTVEPAQLALYVAVSDAYLADATRESDPGGAWERAVRTERGEDSFIVALEKTNTVGTAHRLALETCEAG